MRSAQLLLQRDFGAALRHLNYAIDKKPQEDAFYFLRGLTYLQLGDNERARSELEVAEKIAGSDQLKRNYHSKMEMLMSEQK